MFSVPKPRPTSPATPGLLDNANRPPRRIGAGRRVRGHSPGRRPRRRAQQGGDEQSLKDGPRGPTPRIDGLLGQCSRRIGSSRSGTPGPTATTARAKQALGRCRPGHIINRRRRGFPGQWTCDDMEAARLQANELARPNLDNRRGTGEMSEHTVHFKTCISACNYLREMGRQIERSHGSTGDWRILFEDGLRVRRPFSYGNEGSQVVGWTVPDSRRQVRTRAVGDRYRSVDGRGVLRNGLRVGVFHVYSKRNWFPQIIGRFLRHFDRYRPQAN